LDTFLLKFLWHFGSDHFGRISQLAEDRKRLTARIEQLELAIPEAQLTRSG
jgi:hypothetical protein